MSTQMTEDDTRSGDRALFAANIDPCRALIIDDTAFYRSLLRRELQRTFIGVDVDEIASVDQLHDQLNQTAYQLILVDFLLPDGTGDDALDIIFSRPDSKGSATLMLSASPAIDTAPIRRHAHNVEYLQKCDVTRASLKNAILRALQTSDLKIDGELLPPTHHAQATHKISL